MVGIVYDELQISELTRHRRPEGCHPAPLRNPIRRPRLPGPRNATRAGPKNVRETHKLRHSIKAKKEIRITLSLLSEQRSVAKLTRELDNSKNLTVALNTLSTDTQLPPDNGESDQQSGANTDPSNPRLSSIQLPPEIIDYVDSARNPDIYTREFVELVQRGNQDLKGKREAFAGFRDVLAREMRSAMPECAGEVDRVVAVTGGAGESNLNSSSNSN